MASSFEKFVFAVDQLEKASERRKKEAARREKQRQKEQERTDAAQSVANYDQYIAGLLSMHIEDPDTIDWESIRDGAPPPAPANQHLHEQQATFKQKNYKPSALDRMFGLTAKKTAGLARKVAAAQEKDKAEFEKMNQQYEKDRLEWEKMHLMAKGILERDTIAYKDALTSFYPFTDIKGLGTKLDLTIHSDHIVADLQVVGDDYVPNYVLSLTSTGKLSQKDMPVTKFNTLYQDHICSCALRVGRELLAFLPVRKVMINAISDVLNSSTGNRELQTILSVAMVPEKLAGMNFKALDPSDSMKNFEHNMAFSKTGGFSPVEKLAAGVA